MLLLWLFQQIINDIACKTVDSNQLPAVNRLSYFMYLQINNGTAVLTRFFNTLKLLPTQGFISCMYLAIFVMHVIQEKLFVHYFTSLSFQFLYSN